STLPLSDELELDELPHAPSAIAMAASATIAVSLPRCPLNASPLRDRSGSAPRPVSAVAATERLPQGARNLRTGAAGCQPPHEPVAEGETPLPKRDHEVVADPGRGPPRPLTPHRSWHMLRPLFSGNPPPIGSPVGGGGSRGAGAPPLPPIRGGAAAW